MGVAIHGLHQTDETIGDRARADAVTSAVALRHVQKRFGTFSALHDVTFDISDNEFFTLLGPSGCGKTTLLRLIAGFEETSAGTIHLYGEEIEDLPPNKRPVNTVFQSYALFPHMNVTQNIGFGLQMLGWTAQDVSARVRQMVEMVKLQDFVHRKPSQMSGGQQQRVALARAMAPRPKVLLLDEPLSALDLKLRQEMRQELKRLQRETGITFIFVTHDQEEALSMSDRIAVMSAGQVQQVGTPTEIYEAPVNRFVADFIGETNLLDAVVVEISESSVMCRLPDGEILHAASGKSASVGQVGIVSIRPERISLRTTEPAGECLIGTLGGATFLGTDTQFDVHLSGTLSLVVRVQNQGASQHHPSPGTQVYLTLAEGAARFLEH